MQTQSKRIASNENTPSKIPCSYFGKCGGCVWQNLTQKEYIERKNTFILRAFQDAALSIQLEPMILIPIGTRRRASFAFMHNHFGFHEIKSHRIVDIDCCPLLTNQINETIPALKQCVTSLKSNGSIFVLDTPLGLDIHIKDNKGVPELHSLELLSSLADKSTIARVIYNDIPIFEKAPLPDSADSFAQPSIEGEKALSNLILNNIKQEHTAVDLFCGKGTFTLPMLEKGLSVIGYDCATNVQNLGSHGQQRDLFRNPLTANELEGVDLAVLDPPRAGALAQTKQLAQSNIATIIMVSCNPKTAARDCKILCDNGWHIHKAIPVDQFTYSNHIEIVLVIRKINGVAKKT